MIASKEMSGGLTEPLQSCYPFVCCVLNTESVLCPAISLRRPTAAKIKPPAPATGAEAEIIKLKNGS